MALAHAIMTALIDDEMSGYELARSFDGSLGFFWQASHQQIYRELARLTERRWVRRRLVSQKGRPDKISYALSHSGRRALHRWVAEESRQAPSKDDLLIRLCNLDADNVLHLAAEIKRRREQTMQRLYLYEKIIRAHYPDPQRLPTRRRGVYLALRAAIVQAEQALQWCDEALALLSGAEA